MSKRFGGRAGLGNPGGWLAAAAVVVSVGLVALASSSQPEPQPLDTSSRTVPTSRAQLACADSTNADGVATSVLAVTPPFAEDAGATDAGKLQVSALGASSGGADPVGQTGQVGVPITSMLTDQAQPAVTVDAKGALAPSAYAAQRTTLQAGRRGGLAISACVPTADTWWFTGIDTSVGSTARLVLSNPSPAVTVADLTFYGPDGIVKAVGADGIAVAPQSRQSLDLSRYAPGLDAVAVRVKATRGRVAAAVNVSRVDGVTPAGNEWVPASTPPSTDVLVDAGDAGPGDQKLVLTNPSPREALVQVQVLDTTGPFTPPSLTDLRIKPGRTVIKDISEATGSSSAAVRVTTDEEQATVLAAVLSESRSPVVDLATSSSSPALTGPAVIPLFTGTRISAAFASVEPGGGVVKIQAYDRSGMAVGEPTRLSVKSRTTVSWAPPPATSAPPQQSPDQSPQQPLPKESAYLVVTLTDGEMHGDVTYHAASGLSSIPLVSGSRTVTRPAVHPG